MPKGKAAGQWIRLVGWHGFIEGDVDRWFEVRRKIKHGNAVGFCKPYQEKSNRNNSFGTNPAPKESQSEPIGILFELKIMSDDQPFGNKTVLLTRIRALPATAGGANFKKEDGRGEIAFMTVLSGIGDKI